MILKLVVIWVMFLALSACTKKPVRTDSAATKRVTKPVVRTLKKELPALMVEKDFDSRHLALAANHYIAMGRKEAVEELKSLEQDRSSSFGAEVNRNYRIAWLCRILFQSKTKAALRAPGYGGLMDLPRYTMTLNRWHEYPLVESEGVYFVLSSSYILAGLAERASDYVDYCDQNGTFRKDRLRVPTKAIASKAYDALIASDRWKALKWKDKKSGGSYTLSEGWVLDNLKKQIPSE